MSLPYDPIVARALDQLVVAAQGLVRQQARDQDLGIVIHRAGRFQLLQLRLRG